MRVARTSFIPVAGGFVERLKGRESGITSIEYLIIAALLVIVFGSLRYTILELLLSIYSFFIQMICSPVM